MGAEPMRWRKATPAELREWERNGTPAGERVRLVAGVGLQVAVVERGRIPCQFCGELHEAEYSHDGQHSGRPIYVVICTVDGFADYYTDETLVPA